MTGRAPTNDDQDDLLSIAQLMKILDEPERAAEAAVPDTRAPVPDAPPPRITRMPQGIEVSERRLGRAIGHWVLQVRCECGRRWFEVEAVQTADCPRCGALVIVDVEPR
jgi:hypothetical protein